MMVLPTMVAVAAPPEGGGMSPVHVCLHHLKFSVAGREQRGERGVNIRRYVIKRMSPYFCGACRSCHTTTGC